MKIDIPVKETIFGMEDGIVSTLGVVVGVAAATDSRKLVILTALVLIVVESLSMAAGTYLSNKSEMEIAHIPLVKTFRKSVSGSLFMGASYVLGGFFSIIPFFFLAPYTAILPSIALSIAALFSIGYFKGQVAGINKIKSGLEMSLVSLTAAIIGYFVGKVVSGL
ncbi:MAG: hypothetical protein UW23_C0019G0012 [Candidatus Collierbacteria bacterium GW2011_GWA1_44_12]|uniref:VIT family protein n=1 Tax=Candidatus Collierbacteria bacterium GW2011_GWA1_44_12 TaxID=1618376 RepID=A0A0G1GLN4_9BACT|nr:MAG: hypothetical protein UW23_C0019G0012 [Candidatus Collierbacteria bacterium GW2011_GWA1_44_12]